jgi:prevent-host-death family protein
MNIPNGAVTVTDFTRRSADTLLRLNLEGAPIALTRNGRSVAVLLDVDSYARLLRARESAED